MTLKRLALMTTFLLTAMLTIGCANTSGAFKDTLRLGSMDSNPNPLAMGAGDALGTSLHRAHHLN